MCAKVEQPQPGDRAILVVGVRREPVEILRGPTEQGYYVYRHADGTTGSALRRFLRLVERSHPDRDEDDHDKVGGIVTAVTSRESGGWPGLAVYKVELVIAERDAGELRVGQRWTLHRGIADPPEAQ